VDDLAGDLVVAHLGVAETALGGDVELTTGAEVV